MSAQDDSARDPVRLHAELWTAESPFLGEAEEEQTRIDPWFQAHTPFVEGRELEEMYAAAEAEWEADLAALEVESPLGDAFEQGRPTIIEPEELEEEFVEEDEWSDMDESPADEAEAHDEEALAVLEHSIGELYDEEAAYTEEEASPEDATYLEEEPLIPEEAWIEPEEEEDDYPLEEAAYSEGEAAALDEAFFIEPEEEVELEEEALDASRGKTIYLPIQLNKTVPPKVGVFIPSSFRPTAEINFIVYFHGHIIRDCKTYQKEFNEKGIEYYWNTPLFKCLREDLVASGRGAILIAPTFMPIFGSQYTPSSNYGDLNKPGKFDFLVNETLTQLIKRGALPADAQARNIILSGHSAGGLPMQAILDTRNSLNTNVTECWGFECLYFGTPAWEKWLQANPRNNFRHFRREAKFTGPTKTLKKYPNFIDVKDGTDHCLIVKEKWRQAIDSGPAFQRGGKSPMSSTTSGSTSGLFSLLAGLPGLATLPLTFITALSKGFRDENDLTNLIFFARHPELEGRKLTGSDPQSLKDEWVGILRNIVRPTIRRLKEAATSSSASPTASAKAQPSPSAPVLPTPGDDKFPLTEWKLESGKIVVASAGGGKKKVAIEEAPAVFLPEIIGMARDRAKKDKKNDLADKLDPATWFNKFTQITFLGRRMKSGQYLHLEMAKLLKAIESEMVKKYGGDANSVGDMLLNKSKEGISGSRLVSSTATFSMHMFGLAVDVNYLGNPFIQSEEDVKALNNVLKNAALLMNKPILSYQQGYAKDKFDRVQQLDAMLEKYFGLLDAPAELERLVQASSSSEWSELSGAKAKIQKNLDTLAGYLARSGKKKDYFRKGEILDLKDYFKKHAILDFDKRFVVQMEESGLSWGGHYGDMMHFDMRAKGVGSYIEKARLDYAKKVKNLAKRLLEEKKYGAHSPA